MNITSLIRPSILTAPTYSSARDEFKGQATIWLDANENPFGMVNRYPDPYQRDLKSILSERKNIRTENLFVGNGSDECIDLLFRIFCKPSIDEVIQFTPTYGMYTVSAALNDVKMNNISLNNDFDIPEDWEEQLQPFVKSKLLFLCSPNNPTGNLLNAKRIEAILKTFQGIVIVDEAYIDFAEAPSFSQRLNEFPNLVVLQTLSKAYAMAGLRIGLAIASEEIIAYMNKVKPPYNVSGINQKTAIDLLQNTEVVSTEIALLKEERVKMRDFLQQQKNVVKLFPSDSNFLCFVATNGKDVYDKCLAEGIVLRKRKEVDPNALRISIGSPEENKKVQEILKKLA